MSYIVIKVYSFECDYDGCEEIIEAQRPSLPEAKDEIKTHGWQVLPKNVHLCPKQHRSE